MRIYLPSTNVALQEVLEHGGFSSAPLTAFAVTPGLREWYVDDDLEELEYAAMSEAARASLRLLDAEPGAARRRAVVSADVPDSVVTIRDDLDRGVVQVSEPLALSRIVSVHIDDADAQATVAAAAAAVIAADLGDLAAQDVVDDAEGHELSWYASQEIGAVLALL